MLRLDSSGLQQILLSSSLIENQPTVQATNGQFAVKFDGKQSQEDWKEQDFNEDKKSMIRRANHQSQPILSP